MLCFYAGKKKLKLRIILLLPHRQIKYPVDFDDELKTRDSTSDTIKWS